MSVVFDSRDFRYRSPFGAQPVGQAIFFRICLPRQPHCSAAYLCVNALDAEDSLASPYSMFWAGMEGTDAEWWECHYTPDKAGIYAYWFTLDTAEGRQVLVREPDGKAAIQPGNTGERWQITCFEEDFKTPDWLAGGILYQIFPDRFSCSGLPKEGVPADRIRHDSFEDMPVWQPDSTGEIRNNDYFGGDFKGIEQRLDYLASLGVTAIYLNPIFEAHSNHRYDTADYSRIDPLLGSEEDFRSLVRSAASLGIRILLDGVFSHTGADSVYFNREGRYGTCGAVQSKESPYFSWYRFSDWPTRYQAWWGFPTLPEVNETDPAFMAYITGEQGIVRGRIREGVYGWRLDVADELPDEFLDALRYAVKAENSEALLLGEVWEDASNKHSYGHLRRYLLGRQLDSVMNYPFREAILAFLRGGKAEDCRNRVMDIVENYPPQVTRLLMNSLSTHDTERILTMLEGEPTGAHDRAWQAAQRLTHEQRERGLRRMRLASALLYTLPGVPCIYYGDEAGMEGYRDPFNRGFYPWGQEDGALLHWYRRLGQLRRACKALQGDFVPLLAEGSTLVYQRNGHGSQLLCAFHADDSGDCIELPPAWHGGTIAMGDGVVQGSKLLLPAQSCALLYNE